MENEKNRILEFIYSQKAAYAAIIAFSILYFVTKAWFFGILAGLGILLAVLVEFADGVKKHGFKKEIKETLLALAVALAAWFSASFILQTPSPLNAVVSCSMLPHISRGDMIVLTQEGVVRAPSEKIHSIANFGIAEVYERGEKRLTANGSIYNYCISRQEEEICKRFVLNPESFYERHGEVALGYEKCSIVFDSGKRVNAPCVKWLEVNGRRYYENLSNDVFVYQPQKGEYYARVGDIIHRAFIILESQESGKRYALTKGDNNPVFDFQVYDEKSGEGNFPVEVSRSKGRILFSVPYLGYFKLFISPLAMVAHEECDRHYERNG